MGQNWWDRLVLRIRRIGCWLKGHAWDDEFGSPKPNTGSWCIRCGRGW